MNLAKILVVFAAMGIIGIVVVGGCFYSGYNSAITLDEKCNESWSEVDNQLKRRFDLLPNLVETVKGVAAQEKDVFLGVAEARKAYTQAQSVPQKAEASSGISTALGRLLMIQERYPELRSNEAFMKLQDSVEGTENRLAVARKRYNESVSAANVFGRKMLGSLYASMAGVEKRDYFEVAEEEKATPKIDFSTDSKGS